jgi:predicted nuclease with TOPRIM domain
VTLIAALIALGLGIVNIWLVTGYHNEASKATASDDHVNRLIDEKLDPKLAKINDQLGQLSRDVSRIEGKLNISLDEQQRLKSRVDQQIALADMTDPKRIDRALAVIRTEVEKARFSKQPVPVAEYRAAVRDLPD